MNIRKRHILLTVSLMLALVLGITWAVHYFSPFRIRHIQLVPVPDNRLRLILEIETSKDCDAVVAYWQVNSADTLYSTVSRGKTHHAICLTNLVGLKKYQFRVLTYYAGKFLRSSLVHGFSPLPIYQATPYFTLDTLNPSVQKMMEHTYFLTEILSEPGSAVILNCRGDIVWYAPFKKGVKVAHWTSDKTILCIIGAAKIPFSGGDEIMEMDLTGKVLTDLVTGRGEMDKLVHHEVNRGKDGNIYALTFDKKIFDLTVAGGLKADTVSGDGVVMFDKGGHKIWEWSVFKYLNPIEDTAINRKKKDWLHANSLYRDQEGNFLISFRNLDQVWKIDYPTGKVLWKFGRGGDFQLPENDYFSGQHAVHINTDNQLMLLDNGVKKGISRALSFQFDSAGGGAHAGPRAAARANIDVSLPKEYFCASKGSAELVDGNKILFSLTDPRLFLLTDLHGKILWKISVGGDPYRIEAIADFLNDKPETDAGKSL